MNYLFPFRFVPKGSKIILFGDGDAGKDFFMQINELGNYYTLIGWTSSTLDAYEISSPYMHVKEIPSFEFDYIVVAAINKKPASEIKTTCLKLGVPEKKIIWKPGYYQIGREKFPQKNPRVFTDLSFYMDIIQCRCESESIFGGFGRFYQSYYSLGIPGQRDSGERILLYNIPKIFEGNGLTVLDIGCNCGFFDLQVATYAKHIVGIDIDPDLIKIANMTKKFQKIKNADFHVGNIFSGFQVNSCDVVFSFAVYGHVIGSGISADDFVSCTYGLINPEGYLFFESQDLDIRDERKRFEQVSNMFLERGMKIIFESEFRSDFAREIKIFKKIK